MAIGLLLPIAVLFVGAFWFIGKYDDNKNQIMSLGDERDREEERMMSGVKAERRRTYFNSISLSKDIEDSAQAYKAWLQPLCIESGLKLAGATPGDESPLKFKRKIVGERKTVKVTASGNLGQLTDFLTRFYSVDALHRINSLKIVPQNETAGGEQKIRTGILSIVVEIEVLGLATADLDDGFVVQPRPLARSKSEYEDTILRRNIFGPANNTPTLTARPRQSYDSETEVEVSMTGKDADKSDALVFELIDSPFDGVELTQRAGSRSAKLIIPGQLAGKYDFKVKVTDNGFPSKESFEEFSVTFADPEVTEPEDDGPPPVPFKHASQMRITGISLGRDGDWLAWITIRTTDENYKLRVGESLHLDGKEWFVDSIKPTEVVLRVGEKFFVGRPNARERGVLKEIENPNPAVKVDLPDQEQSDGIKTQL